MNRFSFHQPDKTTSNAETSFHPTTNANSLSTLPDVCEDQILKIGGFWHSVKNKIF
jgi:hypothetical protein